MIFQTITSSPFDATFHAEVHNKYLVAKERIRKDKEEIDVEKKLYHAIRATQKCSSWPKFTLRRCLVEIFIIGRKQNMHKPSLGLGVAD